MDTKEVLDRIRAALNQVQFSGQSFVFVPALLQFLADLERSAPEATELRKLQQDSNIEWFRSQHQMHIELLRSVVDTAKAALTSSILINGGATVVLLAFAGTIINKGASVSVPSPVVNGLVLFGFGVLAAAIASGATYAAQFCYRFSWQRSAIGFHIAAIALVIGSYVLFAAGLITAHHAFL